MEPDILRYVNLARKIRLKSETGQINWSRASFVSTFEAPMGDKGLVAIQMINPQPNAINQMSSYNLAFKNERGETFYNLRDSEIKDIPDIKDLLEGIYRSAQIMQDRSNNGFALSNIENFIDSL